MKDRVIGIIGGMGSEATVDLFHKIVRCTPAKTDHEHLRILIDNNPEIPSRMDAFDDIGCSPLPLLIKTAISLKRMGADVLGMPCNSAHYYLPEIERTVDLPVVDMIKETAKFVVDRTGCSNVGLLATSGLLRTKIYDNEFAKHGADLLVPNGYSQELLMKAILAVKAKEYEKSYSIVETVASDLVEQGAKCVILGCTELPLVIKGRVGELKVIDPTQVLASKLVAYAKNLDSEMA